ncbi:signal peptidase II [Amycolatopsis sp. NPDC003865]
MFLLVDLLLKWWAEADLPGRVISLGLIDLRLAFNPGVAFSLGAGMPSWIVLTITGLISAGVAVFAWREAPKIPLAGSLGLAAVLGGALGNVIDRAGDGVVTDYLHTGWWPTFNLADVFIICGAGLLLLATAFQHRPAGQSDGMKTRRTSR